MTTLAQYQRLGIPMSRSTLTDLFHAAAEKLAPLWQRLLWLVAQSDIVQADETSLVMQKPFRRGFVWTFLSDEIIALAEAATANICRHSVHRRRISPERPIAPVAVAPVPMPQWLPVSWPQWLPVS